MRYRIIDTAGLRSTSDAIESLGVDRALEAIRNSSLLLYLYDASETTAKEALEEMNALNLDIPHRILVANKSDLSMDAQPMSDIGCAQIQISAKYGKNIEELCALMHAEVIGDTSLQDQSIVTNARHFDALTKAHESLIRVREGMRQDIPSDLIAMDIRQASYHLGTIIGKVDPDDLLDYVFSNFCIGK